MVFKSLRNSLSGTVATWAFSGHAHHVTQDHPVYIPCAGNQLIQAVSLGSGTVRPLRPPDQPVRVSVGYRC
jgi:hypothetical protein